MFQNYYDAFTFTGLQPSPMIGRLSTFKSMDLTVEHFTHTGRNVHLIRRAVVKLN
jgi:hypothetical protein